MSRKHAELEREFIEELANRTGRTLGEWMTAIDATSIADRNAIIDWLRPQGLTFAHASWLERIHHNGGRPIYVGTTAPPVQPPLPVEQPTATLKALTPKLIPRPAATAPTPPAAAPAVRHTSPPPSTYSLSANTPAANSPSTGDPISALLARGKGLKPLADMVLREIARAVPGSTTAATGDLLEFANPAAYACLHIGPKELRLGLSLPGMTPPAPVQAARLPGAPLAITHMLVLSDARQVDNAMIQLVVLANGKTNPT